MSYASVSIYVRKALEAQQIKVVDGYKTGKFIKNRRY